MSELVPGTVTIADLYRELVGMRQDVGKALVRIEVIDSRNKDADGLHADHEQRLRALEAFRWKLTGLALTIGTVAGIISSVIGDHIH